MEGALRNAEKLDEHQTQDDDHDTEDAGDDVRVLQQQEPNVPPRIVTVTNTTVKPAMNNATPSSSRLRSVSTERSGAPPVAVALAEPPRYPRYPGTSGSTHGDANEIRPARTAIGIAIHNAPPVTSSPGFMANPRECPGPTSTESMSWAAAR